MLSVVPVAMAMLPAKVLQDARAVASPEFWMVVVPEILHDAATERTSQYGGSMINLCPDDDNRRSSAGPRVASSVIGKSCREGEQGRTYQKLFQQPRERAGQIAEWT